MAFDSIGPNWFEIGSIARQSNRPKENKKPKESDRSVALIRRVPIGQRKHAHSQHSQQQPISGDLWKSSFDRIKNRTAFHISKSISSRPVLFFLFFFFRLAKHRIDRATRKKRQQNKRRTAFGPFPGAAGREAYTTRGGLPSFTEFFFAASFFLLLLFSNQR